MVDDFMRCLAALPCSPQSLAVQTQVAMYAFARGYERTHDCPSALEFRPRVIDTVLAKKYMIEEIWRITEMTGLTLRRSQAVARGAHRPATWASPRPRARARHSSATCPGLAPHPA